ncbi:MAG TPA: DUF432 domain-containing protein [Methanocorpusculum sp.]|nr:DUF432 domain-containing protein [Methanocorpusculum sp.]
MEIPNTAGRAVMPFGSHPFSFAICHPRLDISFTEKQGLVHYHRRVGRQTFEADLATSNPEFRLTPIPPMLRPAPVTDFLQIRFNEINLEPASTTAIYLTAPLEVAVTLGSKLGSEKRLDTLGFAVPKFALYGTATRGILTRFVRSEVGTEPRPVKNYREFLLRVLIENTTQDWVSLGRIILYMNNLVFFYDETQVSSSAKVTILKEKLATVLCTDTPTEDGMTRVEPSIPKRKFGEFCNVKKVMDEEAVIMDMGLI